MFNYVDIVLLLSLILFGVQGYLHGFIKSLGSIISFFLAITIGSFATSFLIRQFDLNPFAVGNLVLLVLVFALVAAIIGFIVGIIISILEATRKIIPFSGTLNSLLGTLLGLVEGIIFISAVFIFTEAYGRDGKVRDAVLHSLTADWFSGLVHFFSYIFPTVIVR